MKVVINRCFGGFGLSAMAIARIAEIQGRKCFFFDGIKEKQERTVDDCNGLFFSAYDTNDLSFLEYPSPWHTMTMDEKTHYNDAYDAHSIPTFRDDRTNPILIQVVEELGEKANGVCASLEIVEIPDDVEWEISEYDGNEHIAERHRTW